MLQIPVSAHLTGEDFAAYIYLQSTGFVILSLKLVSKTKGSHLALDIDKE